MSDFDDNQKAGKARTSLNNRVPNDRNRLQDPKRGMGRKMSIVIVVAAVIVSALWLFGREGVDHNATISQSPPITTKPAPSRTD